jgi:hypothetical protein
MQSGKQQPRDDNNQRTKPYFQPLLEITQIGFGRNIVVDRIVNIGRDAGGVIAFMAGAPKSARQCQTIRDRVFEVAGSILSFDRISGITSSERDEIVDGRSERI